MTEVITNQPDRAWELRGFAAKDVAPITRIISKIGVREFAPILRSDEVMDTFRAVVSKSDAEESDYTYAGLTAIVEIAGIVFDNYTKAEDELLAFLASLTGKSKEDVSSLPLDTFAELLVAVVRAEDFKNFFKVALRFAK